MVLKLDNSSSTVDKHSNIMPALSLVLKLENFAKKKKGKRIRLSQALSTVLKQNTVRTIKQEYDTDNITQLCPYS